MSNQIGFSGDGMSNCNSETQCNPDLEYITRPTVRVVGHTGYCDIRVPMWDTIGCEDDNIVRMYNKGQCTCLDGEYWFAKHDKVVSKPGTSDADWEGPYTKCELLKPTTTHTDVFISDMKIDGNTLTITRSDGTTYTDTITHPAQSAPVKVDGCSVTKAGDGTLSAYEDILVTPDERFKSVIYYSDAQPDMQLNTFPNWVTTKDEKVLVTDHPKYSACDNAVIIEVESQSELHIEDGVATEGVLGHRVQSKTTTTGGGIERITKAGHNSYEGRYNTGLQTIVVPIDADGTISVKHEYRTKRVDQFPADKVHTFTGGFVKIVGFTRVRT